MSGRTLWDQRLLCVRVKTCGRYPKPPCMHRLHFPVNIRKHCTIGNMTAIESSPRCRNFIVARSRQNLHVPMLPALEYLMGTKTEGRCAGIHFDKTPWTEHVFISLPALITFISFSLLLLKTMRHRVRTFSPKGICKYWWKCKPGRM